jgi:uncharacterized protein YkwD
MAQKLLLTLALLPVFALALASSAGAAGIERTVGLEQGRAIDQPQRLAHGSSLIASQVDCPRQDDLSAPVAAQEEAMRCMTDYARGLTRLTSLSDAQELDLSAKAKAIDVLSCDSFSHFACGRDFTYWMREAGYLSSPCWHAGENLAWGTGSYGTVRAIFQAWMRSPTHRHNILGDYSQLGVSLRVGNLAGQSGARVWTQHFGTRC